MTIAFKLSLLVTINAHFDTSIIYDSHRCGDDSPGGVSSSRPGCVSGSDVGGEPRCSGPHAGGGGGHACGSGHGHARPCGGARGGCGGSCSRGDGCGSGAPGGGGSCGSPSGGGSRWWGRSGGSSRGNRRRRVRIPEVATVDSWKYWNLNKKNFNLCI